MLTHSVDNKWAPPADRAIHWAVRPAGVAVNELPVYKVQATSTEMHVLQRETGASSFMYCGLSARLELIPQEELDFVLSSAREAAALIKLLNLQAKPVKGVLNGRN